MIDVFQPEFIPGLALAERFYREVVGPLLCSEFANLRHSAALIGSGSEVLGFDTPMSTDHDWGPRVQLFLAADEYAQVAPSIEQFLHERLPQHFLGYPTRFDSDDHHRVTITTVRDFCNEYLAFDIANEIEPPDWLTIPQQKLRTITSGAVFHDDLGLQTVRERFTWYPRDVWLYLLVAGWARVGQEDHLMGRAGFVGDELGSALIASRLVRDLMQLCFLMERQYAPYPKWFGTAFGKLACAPSLTPVLQRVQLATTWPERQNQFNAACAQVAALHNTLGITDAVPVHVASFHTRPFDVLNTGDICDALLAQIADENVKRLANKRLIGSIDQFSDSTDLREDTKRRSILKKLCE